MFGVVIPGFQVQLQFEEINGLHVVDLPNPRAVNNVAFFLTTVLPSQEVGAALYFSTPPFDGKEFIGAIANTRPSDIFHTGWALNPTVNTLESIKLIVEVLPLSELETAIKLKDETHLTQGFAQKVAKNLINYLESFSNEVNDDYVVVPLTALNKWYERFTTKL